MAQVIGCLMTDNIININDFKLKQQNDDTLVVYDNIANVTHVVSINLLKEYINGEIEADDIEDYDGLFRAIINSYLSMLLE